MMSLKMSSMRSLVGTSSLLSRKPGALLHNTDRDCAVAAKLLGPLAHNSKHVAHLLLCDASVSAKVGGAVSLVEL